MLLLSVHLVDMHKNKRIKWNHSKQIDVAALNKRNKSIEK